MTTWKAGNTKRCGHSAHLHVNGCDGCKAYQRGRVRRNRAARFARGDYTHGSAGWDVGCRCPTCTSAHRRRFHDYYHGKAAAMIATRAGELITLVLFTVTFAAGCALLWVGRRLSRA